MLFFENIFIFIFLPIIIFSFYLCQKKNLSHKLVVLFIASTIFYSYWNIKYLPILLLSIIINYLFGLILSKNPKKTFFLLFSLLNLLPLIYFKYFPDNLMNLFSENFTFSNYGDAIIPIGISFFTFQQINYLFNVYKKEIKIPTWIEYITFISFFPQLIAGPIITANEILPQIKKLKSFDYSNVSVGFSIFVIGLSKKILLADNLAIFADKIFLGVENGVEIFFFEAWLGAICFGLQIYFDFSAYSDMAIGLGRMFGFKFPVNFLSPYKSKSIIEFWRCWHITLSRFLKNFIYIPLGGSKGKSYRTYLNLMITMILGGIWHGSGLTFVIWGFAHGLLLAINHLIKNFNILINPNIKIFFTFTSVIFLWVAFRSNNIDNMLNMWSTMLGFGGISISSKLIFFEFIPFIKFNGFHSGELVNLNHLTIIVIITLFIVFKFPNTYDLLSDFDPALNYKNNFINSYSLKWRPNLFWSILISLIFCFCVLYDTNSSQEFIYYQF